MHMLMYDINITLSTFLTATLTALATVIAVCIGVGVISHNWALAGVILVALAHGMAVRRWIKCAKTSEVRAYDLGRESMGGPSVSPLR